MALRLPSLGSGFLALETMPSSVLTHRKVSKSENQGGATNHTQIRVQTKVAHPLSFRAFLPDGSRTLAWGQQIWAKQCGSCPTSWESPPDPRMAQLPPEMCNLRHHYLAFLLPSRLQWIATLPLPLLPWPFTWDSICWACAQVSQQMAVAGRPEEKFYGPQQIGSIPAESRNWEDS